MKTRKNKKRTFSINSENGLINEGKFFEISDGILVYPFFNSKNEKSGFPFNLCDEFSVAAGIIKAGKISKIHAHSYINEMAFVLEGKITIKVKESGGAQEVSNLIKYESVFVPKGSLVQFDNSKNIRDCHLLFIVGPPFLQLKGEDEIFYEDTAFLNKWEHKEKYTPEERSSALQKLKELSSLFNK